MGYKSRNNREVVFAEKSILHAFIFIKHQVVERRKSLLAHIVEYLDFHQGFFDAVLSIGRPPKDNVTGTGFFQPIRPVNIEYLIPEIILFTEIDKSRVPGEGVCIRTDPVKSFISRRWEKGDGYKIFGIAGRRFKNKAFGKTKTIESVKEKTRFKDLLEDIMTSQPSFERRKIVFTSFHCSIIEDKGSASRGKKIMEKNLSPVTIQ